MSAFLTVLAIALLPSGGNIIGSLLAESLRTPRWLIGAALHAAAGIAIAVVSFDLMPRILDHLAVWLLVTAFLCGAAFSVLLARGVKRLRDRFASGKSGGSAGAWMVYMAIAADQFSDGLMTGAGSAVSSGLGFVLAMSQLVANVPGGFATMANFRDEGVARKRRYIIIATFPIPVFVGATLGFWLLRGSGETIQNVALAFIVGVLLLATVEDTLPQADEPHPPRWISTISFAGGFALFGLLSSYLS
jgi:zinc transporter, ZIP family